MLAKIFYVNGVPIGKPKEAFHLFWGFYYFFGPPNYVLDVVFGGKPAASFKDVPTIFDPCAKKWHF